MSGFVEIPAPENFQNYAEHFRLSYFQKTLGSVNNLGELASALDLGCDPPNTRAILDSVMIEHVSIDADEIRIEYTVELSEFQACKDINGHYTFLRTITGVRSGNAWRFRKHITLEERSTHDEL
jgi:hypothetical protein